MTRSCSAPAGALIDAGKSAAFAWRAAIRAQVARLSSLADARLRERADDLLDLEAQVLLSLAGLAAAPAPQIAGRAIVLARDLLPSQLLALEAARIAGMCTRRRAAPPRTWRSSQPPWGSRRWRRSVRACSRSA